MAGIKVDERVQQLDSFLILQTCKHIDTIANKRIARCLFSTIKRVTIDNAQNDLQSLKQTTTFNREKRKMGEIYE